MDIKFWLLFFSLNLIFIFTKIYQHNITTKELFIKQKLLAQKQSLQIELNNLEKEFLSLKNRQIVLAKAQGLGMQPIKRSQIVTQMA